MALAMESYLDYNSDMPRSHRTKKIFDIVSNVLEWALVVVLLLGGVSTILNESTPGKDPLQDALGSKATLIVFGVGFILLGLSIAYTKIAKRPLALARSLMVSYLVLLFAFIIEAVIFRAPFAEYADSLFFTILAAVLYLRVKRVNRLD